MKTGETGDRARPRAGVSAGFAPRATVADAMALRTPRGPRGQALRVSQTRVFLRLAPLTALTQLIAGGTLIAELRGTIPMMQMGVWFAALALFAFVRLVRAIRLQLDRDYARAKPASFATITAIMTVLGGMWLVPALVWFGHGDGQQQMFIAVVSAALMAAGCATMITIPVAAAAYVVMVGAASVAIALQLHSVPLMVVAMLYMFVLIWSLIQNARHYIDHLRAGFEHEERSELVDLLREFEASGSGGLWELNAELVVTNISRELAAGIGRKARDVVGLPVRALIDPDGRGHDLSTSIRSLFQSLDQGLEFRDLAIPALGSGRWWSLSGKPIIGRDGEISGWRGVGSDITDLRLSGDDAVRAAREDSLTGLANRLLVREQLEEGLFLQLRHQGCALLLVDLDRFKLVNDTLGHAIGDRLLVEVARRLEAGIGSRGSVGRLGGDEFAVILPGMTEREGLAALAERLIFGLSQTFTIGAASLHIGATIGIAVGPGDGMREEQLMRSADLALYRAKNMGRGGHAFFERFMFDEAEDHRLLEHDVRQALHRDGLRLAYQPIVAAADSQVIGYEALLRWNHPTRGEISPETFIPIIEDSGLIHQIGDWVIREACNEAATWHDELRVAVNISAAQLGGTGLAKTVLGALALSGLDPNRLELEVTESVFLGDDEATLASLERLRALGVRLVLDDFGKGYSSFGYLSRAQFSKIKIEQNFVQGAAEGARDCVAIVHAILALARGLGVETTAEGVETEAQVEVMRNLGCSQLQGFYFGRPVPPAALAHRDRRGVRRIA